MRMISIARLLSCCIFLLSFTIFSKAQTCPVELINTSSTIVDGDIYWAIIGQSPAPANQWSYVDIPTGNLITLNEADNTVVDPNGFAGPGGHTPGMYSNYFSKYDEYSTVNLPKMHGARIFISKGSPLYLYAFSGTGGYAGINLSNENDPNQGILYEVIEFTYDDGGYHGNTTRVDEYSFPISMQVEGTGYDKYVGEYSDYQILYDGFFASVPAEFQTCAHGDMIRAPGKGEFNTGGLYDDYFDAYIDQLWARYTNEDISFMTENGEYTGRVSGEVFNFIRVNDGAPASISRKPTTIEILEGSGCLAQDNGHGSDDLVMQAIFCASVNRHVIESDSWSDPSGFYLADPCNHYAKYWHGEGIGYGRLAYGFCYDDVFGQSTLLEAQIPSKITIRLGGGGTEDLTGGNTNGLMAAANIGGGIALCSGTLTSTGTSTTFDYEYTFEPSGDNVIVTFTALEEVAGMVAFIIDRSEGVDQHSDNVGKTISKTFTYEAGELLIVQGKWAFAGGDSFGKEFVYEMGSGCPPVLNVDDISVASEFDLYPNPANDYVNIVSSGLTHVEIYDISGELRESKLVNGANKLSLDDYSAGVYFVKSLGCTKVKKLVVY